MVPKQITTYNTHTPRKQLLILLGVWVFMQAVLYVQFGIGVRDEATKYFDEARLYLTTGHFSEPKYFFYSTYIFLHILFLKLGFEVWGLYLFQLVINLYAMYALYKLALKVTGKASLAFLTTLLTLLSYHWILWTVYLYTESLFCNFIIIFAYLVFGTNEKQFSTWLGIVITVIFILLGRPIGILLLPVIWLLILQHLVKNKKIAIAVVSTLVLMVGFIFLINGAMKGSDSYNFIEPLQGGDILCYGPYEQHLKTVSPVTYPDSFYGVVLYIANNPLQFLKTASLRLVSFLQLVRPHYSSFHNWYLALYYYPLYLLAIPGIAFFLKKNKPLALFILSWCAVIATCVMLTCDDWSNRFNMPLIPFIMLLAATGLYVCFVWINKKLHNNK